MLSVIAHGRGSDTLKSARIAHAAQEGSAGLDPERMFLYFDVIQASLSEAARRELPPMKPEGYVPQSDYFRALWNQYREEGLAEGRAEGEIAGRRKLVTKQLEARFGVLPEEARTQIANLRSDELDAVGQRLLTAQSLVEALGSH